MTHGKEEKDARLSVEEEAVEEAYGTALEALRQAYECFTQYEEKAVEAARLALIAWGEGIAFQRPAGQAFIDRQEAIKAHRAAYRATGQRQEVQAGYLKAKARGTDSCLQEVQALCEEVFTWRDKAAETPTIYQAKEAYAKAEAEAEAPRTEKTEAEEAN